MERGCGASSYVPSHYAAGRVHHRTRVVHPVRVCGQCRQRRVGGREREGVSREPAQVGSPGGVSVPGCMHMFTVSSGGAVSTVCGYTDGVNDGAFGSTVDLDATLPASAQVRARRGHSFDAAGDCVLAQCQGSSDCANLACVLRYYQHAVAAESTYLFAGAALPCTR